jgi:serine/threonine-protein kinase
MFDTDPFDDDPADPERTWSALKQLVDRAFELAPEERSHFLDKYLLDKHLLDEHLLDAPRIRRYAESMLDLGATTVDLAPRPSPGRDTVPPDQQPESVRAPLRRKEGHPSEGHPWEGRQLGPYRIAEELGKGGMGAVYAAERVDGELEHRVAIKVMSRGPLTADLHRRFLLERQVLARLAHPGIARLLDGGAR